MNKVYILICMYCYALTVHAQFSNVKKGDIIDIKGTQGIVFSINENGDHGTIMSVKAFRGEKNAWCGDSKIASEVHPYSKTDGKANTQLIFDYATNNHLSLNFFPVFNWCKQLGEGWYIPAISQLETFINYWLGNDNELDWDEDDETSKEIESTISTSKLINRKLVEAGGIPFFNGVYTSTENENGKIYTYYYNQSKGWWKFMKKGKMNLDRYTLGRAFYDF